MVMTVSSLKTEKPFQAIVPLSCGDVLTVALLPGFPQPLAG
ncbi:hypothetical protein X971_5014 (plasmid) [Agrobacterium tumefaciens LBA4213 (Ach5)]|nr:hypothetical protein X971_5014 [Agrobacterium tumefaciens LBA4213 (Ach5)]